MSAFGSYYWCLNYNVEAVCTGGLGKPVRTPGGLGIRELCVFVHFYRQSLAVVLKYKGLIICGAVLLFY